MTKRHQFFALAQADKGAPVPWEDLLVASVKAVALEVIKNPPSRMSVSQDVVYTLSETAPIFNPEGEVIYDPQSDPEDPGAVHRVVITLITDDEWKPGARS